MQRDRYSPYEFALVVAVAFGWPMLTSLLALSSGATVGESMRDESFGSIHLWFLLGLAVLPYHVAYGLMQAYLYTRLRNLWPLLVNHALGDFVPLLFLL